MNLYSTLQPALPVPLIVGLAVGAALLAVVTALRGRPLHPAWLQAPVLLLRLSAIALIAFILLNPSENVSTPVRASRSVVLVDASASMTMAGTEQGTRWEEALGWTADLGSAFQKAGLPAPEYRQFSVDSEPLPIGTSGDLTLKPDGPETRLAAALERLVASSESSNLDHVMVVSDGCVQDASRLSTALGALHEAGVRLSTRLVGRDVPARNAALVSVLPPRMVRAQSRVVVPVELEAGGVSRTESFDLILRMMRGRRSRGRRSLFRLPLMPVSPPRPASSSS